MPKNPERKINPQSSSDLKEGFQFISAPRTWTRGSPVSAGSFFRLTSFFSRGLQDPIPEIRGWQTRRDRRRHGSPQLVPGCCHQLGQVPLRLLLSSAGGKARQGKTSRKGGRGCCEWETEKGFTGLRGRVLHVVFHVSLQPMQVTFFCKKCPKYISGILILHEIYIKMGLVLNHTTKPLHAYSRLYLNHQMT